MTVVSVSHRCADAVKVGRPKTLDEARTLVATFPKVKAVGVGHSWWKEQFCAGEDSNAVNVVMTELSEVLDVINNPPDPAKWKNTPIPSNFPIKVNEDAATVTVAGGVPQRVVLDYLAEYRYWKQPNGWTLPSYAWFIDQTMAGAVATGTHGSSLRHGSLSSQAISIKLMTANSTIIEITPVKDPHLWKAAGVSVGRLGIITEITFKIVPQRAVKRDLQDISYNEFAAQIKLVEDAYNQARAKNDVDGMKFALSQIDETQAFINYPVSTVWRTDYTWFDKEPLGVILNLDQTPSVQAMDGPAYNQIEKAPVGANRLLTVNTRYWANFYATFLRGYVNPGTFEARRAYLSQTESTTRTATMAPYNQLEVAIPISKAGSCLMEVGSIVYGPENLWDGFRTPCLVRFTSEEEFYISNSNEEPHMWINMEDHISLSSGQPNYKWDRVVELFRERCDARLHWGKYGWQKFGACFDGAKEYKENWCHFGCAVQQLDPAGKFASISNVWNWNATMNGQQVPFDACCTSQGFKTEECACTPTPSC